MKSIPKLLWLLLLLPAVQLLLTQGLPLLLPFLLGWGLALAAEPLVRFAAGRLRWKRAAAAGVGVSLTLLGTLTLVTLLGALTVKELGSLAQQLPDLQQETQAGLTQLRDALYSVAQRVPAGIQPLMERSVDALVGDSEQLVGQVTARLPALLGGVLGKLPGGALTLGTGVVAGFLMSARLPQLRGALTERLPESVQAALHRLRGTLGRWLLAQGKLAAVTCAILAAGLTLLNVPQGALWAIPIALVDAVPLLGTGIVLVPWALVALLQNDTLLAVGLLTTYAAAAITRTVLEPRLVGKQLGLDPLVTLFFLYLGYQLWGFWGLVLSPVCAAAIKTLSADSN